MGYKVTVTSKALSDIARIVGYILFEKKSPQAANNIIDDYDATLKKLEVIAGSLRICDDPDLERLGYRRINFESHKYFMMYRIIEDEVYVERIFHNLQDYINKIV